ncbi:unnamed protein product [Rhodiola kirilowii]
MAGDSSKEQFLKEFGDDYGYPNAPKNIDQIRATEFKRLDGRVYLDHAGASLYSELQMEQVFRDLTTNLYGNPHSQSDSSMRTSEVVLEARQQVLDYCNASAKDYKCIFTSGATAGLKLIGEAFPWSSQSCFMYTTENHNSVLGIREYALSQGSAACAIDVEESRHNAKAPGKIGYFSSFKVMQHPVQRREMSTCCTKENGNMKSIILLGPIRVIKHVHRRLSKKECIEKDDGTVNSKMLVNNPKLIQDIESFSISSNKLRRVIYETYNLFALPSECNFSGLRFNLDLVKELKEESKSLLEDSTLSRGRWMVLVDAAKGCITDPPNLSRYPSDFTVISFYKLFGYPTGLGALIVRNDAAKILKKTYFSGGTVAASIADLDFVKRREAFEESFEDGTVSFLSIASIKHGFKILNTLTSHAISRHTASLSGYTRNTLRTLRHENGAIVCTIYGISISEVQHQFSSVVTFNLMRPDGSWVGYREVEKLASLSGIQLRTGCFCNPGACAKYLGLSHPDLLSNVEAGHVCWDEHDIVNGKPTGAIRVSFGYMSTYEDAREFIDFIVKSFVSVSSYYSRHEPPSRTTCIPSPGPLLKSISVYPIKSCAGFNVEKWPLCVSGLLYDREWILRGVSGDILTQKKVPDMRLIRTTIDLNMKILVAESPRCKLKLWLDLYSNVNYCGKEDFGLNNQRYEVHIYDEEVNQWFCDAIGRPCTLLRLASPGNQSCLNNLTSQRVCRDVSSKLNFVNEAQILLINAESVCDLNNRVKANGQKALHGTEVNPMRFRPNLVISAREPYTEDGWRSLRIGNCKFTSLGGCNRCQMINLDDEQDQILKQNEPLATLAAYRRNKGKILFGILLRYEGGEKEGHDPTHAWLQVGQEIYPQM